MAEQQKDPVQQPATGEMGQRIERLALMVLGQVLKRSMFGELDTHHHRDGVAREWGGVIYVWEKTVGKNQQGALGYTQHEGYSAVNVDIGAWTSNCGCPDGTTPVAWYHTHPVDTVIGHGGDVFSAHSREFIEGDLLVSDGLLLPGYVATSDRHFWRYDPPSRIVPGVNNDKPIPDGDRKGTWGVLKPMVTPI